MIVLLIFYIHIIAAAAVFSKRWQDDGWGEAFLALGFMGVIFAVGWSVTTVILNFFIEKEGFAPWFDRDTMSLLLLTILEAVFYIAYVIKEKQKTFRISE